MMLLMTWLGLKKSCLCQSENRDLKLRHIMHMGMVALSCFHFIFKRTTSDDNISKYVSKENGCYIKNTTECWFIGKSWL